MYLQSKDGEHRQLRWWNWWWWWWWSGCRVRFSSGYLKRTKACLKSGRPLCFWFDEFNWFTWSCWLHISLNAPLMIRAIILVYNRDVRVAASTRKRETGCGFLWMFFKGTPISHCHIKPLLYFTSISVFFSCCLLLSPFPPSLTACNLRNLRHFELHHFF